VLLSHFSTTPPPTAICLHPQGCCSLDIRSLNPHLPSVPTSVALTTNSTVHFRTVKYSTVCCASPKAPAPLSPSHAGWGTPCLRYHSQSHSHRLSHRPSQRPRLIPSPQPQPQPQSQEQSQSESSYENEASKGWDSLSAQGHHPLGILLARYSAVQYPHQIHETVVFSTLNCCVHCTAHCPIYAALIRNTLVEGCSKVGGVPALR